MAPAPAEAGGAGGAGSRRCGRRADAPEWAAAWPRRGACPAGLEQRDDLASARPRNRAARPGPGSGCPCRRASGHQSRRMVCSSTPEATSLTTQMPTHIAPTYREFRDSDEIASISVPAETTMTAPKASERRRASARCRGPPSGSRLNAIPSTYARTTGTIVTGARKTAITPSLPSEIVDPPHRPGEVERHRVEPQVLADQLGPDQQHQEHRRRRARRRGTGRTPCVQNVGPEPSRPGAELLGQALEEEEERRQEARLLLEQPPEHQERREDRAGSAGGHEHDTRPTGS